MVCGRYSIGVGSDAQALVDLFRTIKSDVFEPRLNVAPGTDIPVVRDGDPGREISLMRWGLVPRWAKDHRIGSKLINARSETVATKPSFRSAFAKRRCLVPATGFYEWKKRGSDAKSKQPFYLHLKGEPLFAMAGLCEENTSGESPLYSCTILTTDASEEIAEIHSRMPVVIQEADFARWLDPARDQAGLMQPAAGFEARPISTLVNSPRNQGFELLQRV